MTNPPQPPTIGVGYEHEKTRRLPRWVKITGLAIAVLALIIVVMLMVGGKGLHGSSDDNGGSSGNDSPPAGHKPPFHG